jgi:exopolysaccharide biosynthesis polyprenyl glycosylphosphotransferase
MFKKYHSLLMTIFYILDISLTLLALFVADLVSRLYPVGSFVKGDPPYIDFSVYFAVALIWTIAFRLFPIYHSKRAEPLFKELATVGLAAGTSWCILLGLLFILNYPPHIRIPLIYFGVLDILFLFAFHFSLRVFLRFLRSKGYNLKKVLIVGAGKVGQQIASTLMENPWTGFALVGFLDDNLSLQSDKVLSFPVLGTLDQARSIVKTFDVDDEVIIALPSMSNPRIVEVIHSIDDIPVNVRVTPDLYGVASIRPNIEDLWGVPLIGIRNSGLPLMDSIVKRIVDIIGALVGLLFFAPLMAIAAILIKLDSKGPVLFKQERVGENGRKFMIYKFRTMVDGSEEMLEEIIDLDKLREPVYKLKDDPRVTRIGHFLRRTSIDELPQLINIIKGEMSLVGPRPEVVIIVERYSHWHRKRLMMKPGLTGPAQINGRADLTLAERVQYEIDYISNYSLWKDFKILIKTIPVVIRGIGSY